MSEHPRDKDGRAGESTCRIERPMRLAEQVWPPDAAPVVSVCCLTYNHESFVRQCLDGILMQETTFPIEILVHDDASTDGTQAILREYEARFPQALRPIYQGENQYSLGVRPNLRFNFPRARGKYLATCEGDDYWEDPLQLSTQVGFLEDHSEYVVCYHDARIVDESGVQLSPSKLPAELKRDFSAEELMKCAWTLTLTRCFRNVLSDFPPELGKVLNVDGFLTVLLGKHGKGKYLGQIRPAAYRKHSGSIWSSLDRGEQSFQNLNTFLQIYQYHLRETGRKFATEFLLEVVAPALSDLYPERNPVAAQLRMRDDEIALLRAAARAPGYRAVRMIRRVVERARALVFRGRGV